MTDSPTPALRPATATDVPVIASVCRAAGAPYATLMPGAFEGWAAGLERDGLPSAYEISIVYAGDAPCGFVGDTNLRPFTAYLVALYLFPAHQRRGLGGAVLRAMEARWRVAGLREVVAQVHRGAHWALAFYARHGWEPIAKDDAAVRAWGNGALARVAIPGTVLLQKALA